MVNIRPPHGFRVHCIHERCRGEHCPEIEDGRHCHAASAGHRAYHFSLSSERLLRMKVWPCRAHPTQLWCPDKEHGRVCHQCKETLYQTPPKRMIWKGRVGRGYRACICLPLRSGSSDAARIRRTMHAPPRLEELLYSDRLRSAISRHVISRPYSSPVR